MCSLKFRVWSLEQNTYRYKFPYNSLGQFYVSESGKIFSDFGNTVAPEVEQKNFIVEQYTGLKDKNGKSIYAGDIVANGTLTGVVEYKVDDFCAWTVGATTNGIVLLSGSWTVIGNIHENPELLKNLDNRSLG